MSAIPSYRADARGRPLEVVRFETGAGCPIFLLPVESFPGHRTHCFLVLRDGEETLFDVASNWPGAPQELARRFDEVGERFGVPIGLGDVRRAVISHAHIDHFGGVHEVRDRGVEICIHELDARVLANFEERIVIASKDLSVFLARSGVEPAERAELGTMYAASKEYFRSVEVDRRLRHRDVLPGDLRVIHTPGHCPGLVCLIVDDVILTSDHVLARVSPNQTPQSITPFTGLETYLWSLDRVAGLGDFRVGLGAHEAPIPDVRQRIGEIVAHHHERLDQVRRLLAEPRTVKQVTDALFGPQQGYGRVMAYTEAGAHVEYLHLLGELVIANLDEVAREENPVIRYRAR